MSFHLSLIVYILALLSCAEEEGSNPSNESEMVNPNATKIMPLGASRVEGARPIFESYRYELWKLMIDASWTIDLIGTQSDDANYPPYLGLAFDNDHEGRGGWTSAQILSGIDEWIALTGSPDVVLLSSPGGNDGLQNLSFAEAVANVNSVIDVLQQANADVTIIIEQMAPARSDEMTEGLSAYFEAMQQEIPKIVDSQTTATSQVIAVDMFTGFSDDLLADDVHYNEQGAKFVADRYFQVLTDIIN